MYTEIKKEYYIHPMPNGIELSWRHPNGSIHRGYFITDSQMLTILRVLINHGYQRTTVALA